MIWENVLVVDDDEAFCNMMAAHLERHGYDAEACYSGQEALALIRAKGSFQVMVTDLAMPGMDGVELLRKARGLEPELEVIIVTAEGTMDSAIVAMREDGAYDYLTKPLANMSDLSLSVGRAMSHRRLHYERKTLRTQLFVEVERLRTLAANIKEAVIVADEAGTIAMANPAAVQLFEREFQPETDNLSSLPESLAALVKRWQEDGAKQTLSTNMVLRPGLTLVLSLIPVNASDGTPSGWMLVIRGSRR